MKTYIEFVWAMTQREIKTRYKGAIFGFLWVLINPTFQMFFIGIIFSYFINIPNYFIFLLSGLLPWNFINSCLTRGTQCFVNERSLVKKAKFPLEAIPFSILFSNFIHFAVSILIFLIILVLLGFGTGINLFLLFLSMIWVLTLTGGLLFLTSTLHAKYRDINFITQAFVMVLFYMTPVLYEFSKIPQNLWYIFYLNPFSSVISLSQCSLVGYCNFDQTMLIANICVSLLIFLLGYFVFIKNKNFIVDWL